MNILILEDNLSFLERMRILLLGDFFTTDRLRMMPHDINIACLRPGLAFARHEDADHVLMTSTTSAAFRAIDNKIFDAAFFDHDVTADKSTGLLAYYLQQEHQPVAYLISEDVANQEAQLKKEIGVDQVQAYKEAGRLVVAEKSEPAILLQINKLCLSPVRPRPMAKSDKPELS